MQIPSVNLDLRFNYKIGIYHINFKKMGSSQELEHNALLCLTTNLIDLSNRNPMQSLITFGNDSNHLIQDIKLPIVQFHPIQIYNFENGSFGIRLYLEDREIIFEHIYLCLEIRRVDSYGRI